LTSHVDYELARNCFSKHFGKGLSFSTTPLEVSYRLMTYLK
jgi:inositol hexakisphosphate/diphosphoinositol-pentakisphosphate kinase